MKHSWNPALAAYDRELPLLLALRDEYLAYVRERLDTAKAAIDPESAASVVIEVATADEDDAGAEITLSGDGADCGLQCHLWASADVGDAPGKYVWSMLISRVLSPEIGDARRALAVARQASTQIPTEALDLAPPHALSYAGFDLVRWGQIDIDDPQFGEKLTRVFRSLVTALATTRDAVLGLRGATPAGWAIGVLRKLYTEGTFTRERAIGASAGLWGLGPYVNAEVNADSHCTFTAAGDGRVGFHWATSKADAAARRSDVPPALVRTEEWKHKNSDGVVLVSVGDLARMHAAGDDVGLREIVLTAWRKYRDVCSGAPAAP